METSNPFPAAASRTGLKAEPREEHSGPQRELPDPSRTIAVIASDRRREALEQAWELGEERFTAAECSAMPIHLLHQLCEEAFAALDSEFPAWGARNEYEVLCAEITIRAEAFQDGPTSAPD